MAHRTEYLVFETKHPREFLNITERVRAVVRASGVTDGLVLVSSMHLTSAVYVNDDESGLLKDISAWADRLAPPGTTSTIGPARPTATPISRTSSWDTRSSYR